MKNKMEETKAPRYTIELKQTAKGVWYLGSLKLDVESVEEFNRLIDEIAPKIGWKINELNNKQLGIKKENKENKENKTNKVKEEIVLNPEEERLFNHLKEIRLELARKEGYPPYVIFHDSALRQMAIQKPQSLESMKELIGEKKFEKYGKIFVREIFQFV